MVFEGLAGDGARMSTRTTARNVYDPRVRELIRCLGFGEAAASVNGNRSVGHMAIRSGGWGMFESAWLARWIVSLRSALDWGDVRVAAHGGVRSVDGTISLTALP